MSQKEKWYRGGRYDINAPDACQEPNAVPSPARSGHGSECAMSPGLDPRFSVCWAGGRRPVNMPP